MSKNCIHCYSNNLFYDPENYKDDIPKTLIVNVLSCLDANGRCKNPFDVPVEMDFTEFMYKSEIDEFKNKIYTATLTGFIQRIHCFPGQNVMGQDATFNGHYISITKSPFSRDYYLSDYMHPMDPQNIGPDAIFDKSVPIVWLFYSIIEACEPKDPIEVDEWIKNYSKNSEDMNVIQDNSETIERINARSPELSDTQGCEGKLFEEDLGKAPSTEMIMSCEGNALFRMKSKPETEQGSDRLQCDISSQESCELEIGDI